MVKRLYWHCINCIYFTVCTNINMVGRRWQILFLIYKALSKLFIFTQRNSVLDPVSFFYIEPAGSRHVCFAFLPSLSYPSEAELSKKHTLAFPLVWLMGWRPFCSFLAWAKTRKMRPDKHFYCKLIIFCVQALSKVLRSFPPDT